MHLAPSSHISAAQLAAGKRSLVLDSLFAMLTSALSGGVILVAFALSLHAGPLAIGLLAAIPFMSQAAQLPALALVERVRQRRRIGVTAITAARLIIFTFAALPWVPGARNQVVLLIGAQAVSCVLVSFGSCAINSWFHQLLPREELGTFFAKRLFWGTAVACVGTLVADWLIDHPLGGSGRLSFALSFGAAGLAGFASSAFLARTPEPLMGEAGPKVSLVALLKAPLLDRNFRRLLVFLGSWMVASNVAAPFLTVYLMRQLGLALGTVTSMWSSGRSPAR